MFIHKYIFVEYTVLPCNDGVEDLLSVSLPDVLASDKLPPPLEDSDLRPGGLPTGVETPLICFLPFLQVQIIQK